MRIDAIGMFWEDHPPERVSGKRIERNNPAPIPSSDWLPPKEFPDLRSARFLVIDLETYDPNLLTAGPGDCRGDGHIVGVAIGTETQQWYFPIRHTIQPEMNWDPDKVLSWCSEVLSNPHQPKLGANLLYDLGWFRAEGVEVKGKFIDVQFAEPLLDENASSYTLNALAKKYLNDTKTEDDLYQWCADSYGGSANRAQASNIYRAPVTMVAPYAESDVRLPYLIWQQQEQLLNNQGLDELFDLESRLIPLLLDMRSHGVRVDLDKAQQVSDYLTQQEKAAQSTIAQIDVWAKDSIRHAFDKEGLTYPRTEKGAPSFTKDFLTTHQHPLAQQIAKVRRYNKARSVFVDSYILDRHTGGRLHASFHPLRGSWGGTVSGRFSSSNPNLQNIPARDPELGPLIRSMFVPDEGHQQWRSLDYSQIEYRMLAHYAIGDGSDHVRDLYRQDPSTDFHKATQKLIHKMTGIELPRKSTKNVNFGLCYGMGQATLARNLHLDQQGANDLFQAYHSGVPFVKETYDAVSQYATKHRYIRTILGRRRRFATEDIGTHKALNSLLQGSAADMMKKAMVDCYETGLPIPLTTVHDEVNFSDPGGQDDAHREIKNIMENCMQLRVPVMVDEEIGPSWGECK